MSSKISDPKQRLKLLKTEQDPTEKEKGRKSYVIFLYSNELSISLEQNSEAKDDGLPHIPPSNTVHHEKNSKNGLTMASVNVNSLTAKIDEIRLLVRDKDIDILAVNETKLGSNIKDDIVAIERYTIKRMDRNRQGGGVALYIRDTVGFKSRDDIPNKSMEISCIEVEPPKANPFSVATWYRPPNATLDYLQYLEEN